MVYPILVCTPLLIELASVEALFHRAGFSSNATVLSDSIALPPSILATLSSTLRGNSVSDMKQDDGAPFAVITITSLADFYTGVVVSDENAIIRALTSAAQSTLEILSVPSAAREDALIIPSSPRAARDAHTLLNAVFFRDSEKTILLRTSCTAASMAATLASSSTKMNGNVGMTRSRRTLPPPPAKSSVSISDHELFLFPTGEEHSRSVGRLIAFALYGPLRDGNLWAGRGGSRALTRQELCAEIDAIERHDALEAYTGESMLGDVDAVLRVARADGRVELPRMSLPQIRALLRDIPRDAASGEADFHDIQRLVLAARARRVRDLGLLFPHEPSTEEARVSFMPRAPLLGRATLSANVAATAELLHGPPMSHSHDVWKKSSEVAHRRHHAGLLNSKSQSIAALAEANSATMIPALLANILLLRHDVPGHRVGGDWRNDAPYGLSRGKGTYVPGSVARGVGLHTKLR